MCCYLQAAKRSSGRGELRVSPGIWKFESPLTNPFEKNICSHFHLFSSRWYNSLSLFWLCKDSAIEHIGRIPRMKKWCGANFGRKVAGIVVQWQFWIVTRCLVVLLCEGRKVDWALWRGGHFDRNVVSPCGARMWSPLQSDVWAQSRLALWRGGSRRESTRCFQLCWQYVKRARLHAHYSHVMSTNHKESFLCFACFVAFILADWLPCLLLVLPCLVWLGSVLWEISPYYFELPCIVFRVSLSHYCTIVARKFGRLFFFEKKTACNYSKYYNY